MTSLRTSRRHSSTFFLILMSAFLSCAALANDWIEMGGDAGGEGTTPFTGLSQAPAVNLFSGAMSVSIPIQIPPGRSNSTPDLKLTYSSSAGESPYGFGWDLSLGTIERSTKHGVPTCPSTGSPGNSDEFVLNMNGAAVELVNSDPPNGNLYRAKFDEAYIEAEANKGFEDDNTWVVRDRRGMTYRFGETSNARVNNRPAPLDLPLVYNFDMFMNPYPPPCMFTAVWAGSAP